VLNYRNIEEMMAVHGGLFVACRTVPRFSCANRKPYCCFSRLSNYLRHIWTIL